MNIDTLHDRSRPPRARRIARDGAGLDGARSNAALEAVAIAIERERAALKEANARDLARARDKGHDAAFIDRLTLSDKALNTMVEGLRQVASLADPIGEISGLKYRPSGIQVGQMRVPLGVIGIIYESRPNVTIDAAALCLKSGNAAILRGGSEALECNTALAKLIGEGLEAAGLPQDAVQVVETADRAAVGKLITMTEYVDVIVPRGGKSLIARLMEEARVPMIKHLDGICHVYVDDRADLVKALAVCDNAKTHRYGTCNTMETLLVARGIASEVLPRARARIPGEGSRTARRCRGPCGAGSGADRRPRRRQRGRLAHRISRAGAGDQGGGRTSTKPSSTSTTYGSHHTDAIVTEDHDRAMRFLREVDSASVMVNASTRFADGFEFGLGAEIGISNDKLHARGPVGLEGLTSLKYVVLGHGEVRQ